MLEEEEQGTSREAYPHTGQPKCLRAAEVCQEVKGSQCDPQAGIDCIRRRRHPGRGERERHWGRREQWGLGLGQGHGK